MQFDKINQTDIIIGIEDQLERKKRFSLITDLIQFFAQLIRYRQLTRTLVIRDLKVRYRDSILGVLWSLINPLLMMIVFTVVFTVMAPVAEVEHFPVFLLCGLLPWNFFSGSIMGCIGSITGNSGLIKKTYFPLEILPLTTILVNLVNFVIALVILFSMIMLVRIQLTVWIIYLPVIIIIQIVLTLGLGFLLGTLNVFYRDTHQIMDVLILAWFFATPIFYPIDILPNNYTGLFGVSLNIHRLMYIVNPMASLVANYRVILYDGSPPALDFLLRTAVTAGIIFLGGWWVFHKYSWRFAEEL